MVMVTVTIAGVVGHQRQGSRCGVGGLHPMKKAPSVLPFVLDPDCSPTGLAA